MADLWTKRTGNTVSPAPTWTQATRPSSPSNGYTGKNTDFDGIESYSTSTGKWKIITGKWTTNTRPTTTNIDAGSMGFNYDSGMGLEMWNGSEWVLL